MSALSFAAETFLQSLAETFWVEIANHDIGAHHATQYPSGADARMAMLRLAYLRGREDALTPPADFDADVKRVTDANTNIGRGRPENSFT